MLSFLSLLKAINPDLLEVGNTDKQVKKINRLKDESAAAFASLGGAGYYKQELLTIVK